MLDIRGFENDFIGGHLKVLYDLRVKNRPEKMQQNKRDNAVDREFPSPSEPVRDDDDSNDNAQKKKYP